jgi:hypothetical protein
MRSFARDLSFPRLGGQRAGGGGTPLSAARAWVDAGSDGALFDPTSPRWQDSAQTTPWTTDGDPVGYVSDLSRFASDVLQATAGSRPTGFGGYLLTSGAAGQLSGAAKSPQAGWYFAAACMVVTPGGATGPRNLIGLETATTSRTNILLRGDADASGNKTLTYRMKVNGSSEFSTSVSNAYTMAVPFIVEGWSDGTDIFRAIDGAAPVSVAGPIGVEVGSAQAFVLLSNSVAPLQLYAAMCRLGLPSADDRANIILPYLNSVIPV